MIVRSLNFYRLVHGHSIFLNILFFRPKEWYEEPEKGDRRIKRIVNVEQCNCKREILSHTMVTYEGGDHGNSSISTCSEHSFHRGAKQKVNVFLTPSNKALYFC